MNSRGWVHKEKVKKGASKDFNIWVKFDCQLNYLLLYLNWWRSIVEFRSSNGTQSPSGAGTSQSRTVPSARTASTRLALSARPIRSVITNHALSVGEHATTPTTHTASADGPLRKRIPAHFARKHGTLSRLPRSDHCYLIMSIMSYFENQLLRVFS